MVIKLLAIEDQKRNVDAISEALEGPISRKDQRAYGVNEIKVTYARSKKDAIDLLTEAVKKGQPYDVVLLDIMIPETTPEGPKYANQENGIAVLTHLLELKTRCEVLVYSILEQYQVAIVKVFVGGSVDFIPKSVIGPELQARVLAAGARLLARENAQLLEKRLRDLVPYAETGIAHHLGVCFSRFVQTVVNESGGLEDGLRDRWGLDIKRDSQDAQVRHLIEIQAAARQAKKDWTDIVASLTDNHEAEAECVVEDALKEIKNELKPSLSLNRVEVNGNWNGTTIVRTFRNGADDVRTVFKEILLGGLSEPFAESPTERPVDVTVATTEGVAQVQFKDSLSRIDKQAASLINRGAIIPPGQSFGRVWGLSVAQQLAKRGGGKLNVHSDGDENIITYSIPLAENATSAFSG